MSWHRSPLMNSLCTAILRYWATSLKCCIQATVNARLNSVDFNVIRLALELRRMHRKTTRIFFRRVFVERLLWHPGLKQIFENLSKRENRLRALTFQKFINATPCCIVPETQVKTRPYEIGKLSTKNFPVVSFS